MKLTKNLSLLTLLALAPALQAAPTPTLNVGDAAPKLPGKFIKGEPVTAYESDKVYLVEFWATWCGPCKAQIPHLNELHNKYKDKGLVVVGQNVWEAEPGMSEPFVKNMGDRMGYRVALDTSDDHSGEAARTWMSAAGRTSIPSSFLIGHDGKILWIGHPMDLNEDMIQKALAGTLDAKTVAAVDASAADNKAQRSAIAKQINAALAAKDWDKVDELTKQLEAILPDDSKYMAAGYTVDKLIAQGKLDEALATADAASQKTTTNVMYLSTLSGRFATIENAPPAIYEGALKLVNRTNDLLGGHDVGSMLTLARLEMRLGHQDKAIAWQEQVVANSKPAAKPRMQGFLEDYKAGRMPQNGAMARNTTAKPTTVPSQVAAVTSDTVTADDAPKAAAKKTGVTKVSADDHDTITVKIGDVPPPLLGTFIQGEPVKEFKPGTAYLVEFWATWCAPCRASIPHLNEIHNKYKDKGLVVIGQDVWETDDDAPKPFVEKMGEKMSYRIAIDDKSKTEKGVMADTWMAAAGQHGIPAAFLIGKDGKIAWIGFPPTLTDTTIDAVLNGTFDVASAGKELNDKMAREAAIDKEREKVTPILRRFNSALNAEEWDAARKAYEELAALGPKLAESDRIRIAYQEMRLYVAQKDQAKTLEVAKNLIVRGDEMRALNVLNLATKIETPSPEIIAFADEHVKALKDKSSLFALNVAARVAFLKGDKTAAIDLQQQAVAAAAPTVKPRQETALQSYRDGKLPG